MSRVSCLLCWSLFLLAAFSGCNSGQLPTHSVEGVVRFDDGTSPMFGDVEFYNAENQINARGKLNRDGTFTVGTYSDSDGAVEGKHQIVIIQMTGNHLTQKFNDKIQHDHGELIDSSYFDYRTSNLSCDIKEGTNSVELVVEKEANQTSEGMPE